MSVIEAVTLPAQSVIGSTEFIPLGGDGKSAPLGCYFVTASIVGDASGGTAAVTIACDDRYTNLFAYLNGTISGDAAAGDFHMRLQGPTGVNGGMAPSIVGTIPQVATTVIPDNAAFLWFPPPVYFQGSGFGVFQCPNVDANETYHLQVEVLVFDIDVRRLAPLPWLMLNVPGVSAPASI